jgi:hypothetical protein
MLKLRSRASMTPTPAWCTTTRSSASCTQVISRKSPTAIQAFSAPVLVSKGNVIFDGATRVKAAEELGLVEVPA